MTDSTKFDPFAIFSEVADRHDQPHGGAELRGCPIPGACACPGYEAAQATIPKRDIIDIIADISLAELRLANCRKLVELGLNNGMTEPRVARWALRHLREALGQVAAVIGELETLAGRDA